MGNKTIVPPRALLAMIPMATEAGLFRVKGRVTLWNWHALQSADTRFLFPSILFGVPSMSRSGWQSSRNDTRRPEKELNQKTWDFDTRQIIFYFCDDSETRDMV
ncbi:hypothetical protein PoB_000844400 [Plakobranchus ocellatus]|uniref:Uncharacterized protein n=1 Tax=Plakobranchus ocellatus TaxID=259542 RepID=A0AAV3YIS3_9GAST|nr:hypothetical protein PoB_000844400 [Plakobranchus ocellatus]